MTTPETDRLTVTQIAAEYGIKPSTFRAYVNRGTAPPADGHHDGRTPYWLRETLETWRGYNKESTPLAVLIGIPALTQYLMTGRVGM